MNHEESHYLNCQDPNCEKVYCVDRRVFLAGQKSVANKLKLPERRKIADEVLENKYRYFGNEGFNECIDEVIKLNPDLLGDSSDGSGET